MCLGVLLLSHNVLAENLTVGNKSTATLVASCRINAQSVSFGALATPIYAQSANSNMSILCSKEAPYKIDLTYGLSTNYWIFGGWGGRYDTPTWSGDMNEYDSSGKLLRSQRYYAPQGPAPYDKMAEYVGCKYTADGKCHSPATATSTGSVGTGNMYGTKGDSVAYNIFLPEDNSKIWNIGQNSYAGTGNGITQNIPMKAQLVPSGSTAYPTPDIYTDTVTATITY